MKSKTNKFNTSKSVQMVIYKYWHVGDVTGPQLEKCWNRNGEKYRANLVMYELVEYFNALNEPCLEMTGNVLGSLYNIELANIQLFLPPPKKGQMMEI